MVSQGGALRVRNEELTRAASRPPSTDEPRIAPRNRRRDAHRRIEDIDGKGSFPKATVGSSQSQPLGKLPRGPYVRDVVRSGDEDLVTWPKPLRVREWLVHDTRYAIGNLVVDALCGTGSGRSAHVDSREVASRGGPTRRVELEVAARVIAELDAS